MKQRVFQIEVDDRVLIAENPSGKQFRVQFDITVDALGHVTYCDFVISNLKEETINAMFKRGAVFAVRAGYVDNIDYIFRGIIRNVFRERDGADTNTRIIARGGDLEKSIINKSLGKNAQLSEILQSLADAMGYKLVINKSEFSDKYITGYAMTGDPFNYLTRLATSHDFHWTIEANKLVVFKVAGGRNVPVVRP